MNPLYGTADYRRSRWAYAIECMFEYFVALLVSGAFLSRLLGEIGMSDTEIGIISSLISFAFLFQLASIFVIQRIRNTKRFVILVHGAAQILFGMIYLVPFLPGAESYRQILVVACILFAYFGNYLVTNILYNWGNSFADPHHRAEFSAIKEMISLLAGMAMTLAVGALVDRFTEAGNVRGSFIFCAAAIAIFTLSDLVCLCLIRARHGGEEEAPREKAPSVPLREVLAHTLGIPQFRRVVWITVLWNVANYISFGFLATYQLNPAELAFSVGAVQVINTLGNLGRFAASRPFGRYTDRTSFARGIRLALWFAALSFLFFVCTTPATRYLIVGYVFFHAVSQAGISQNLLLITYRYVEPRYFVEATAIKNSLGGVCGFLSSVVAGQILAAVQRGGNRVLGIPMYGQQLLALLSLAVVMGAIAMTRRVEKE